MRSGPPRERDGRGYTILVVPDSGGDGVKQVELPRRWIRRARAGLWTGLISLAALMLLAGMFTSRILTYGAVVEENMALRSRLAAMDKKTSQLDDAIRRIRLYDTQIRFLSQEADLPGLGPLDEEDQEAWDDLWGRRPALSPDLVTADPMEELHGADMAPGDIRPAELWAMAVEARASRLMGLVEVMEPRMSAMVQDLEDWRSYHAAFPSLWPASGTITSGFGYRRSPFSRTWKFHSGVDIATSRGTPVYATADGVVTQAGYSRGYGRLIEIDHGYGIKTRYAHNTVNYAAEGDIISAGDIIATVGSTGRTTGPHLHFELTVDGQAVDPMDYLP